MTWVFMQISQKKNKQSQIAITINNSSCIHHSFITSLLATVIFHYLWSLVKSIKVMTLMVAMIMMMQNRVWLLCCCWCRGCKSTQIQSVLIIRIVMMNITGIFIQLRRWNNTFLILWILIHQYSPTTSLPSSSSTSSSWLWLLSFCHHCFNFDWDHQSSAFQTWGMEVLPIILILVNVMIIIVVLSSVWSASVIDIMISREEKKGQGGEGGWGWKKANSLFENISQFSPLWLPNLPPNLWYYISSWLKYSPQYSSFKVEVSSQKMIAGKLSTRKVWFGSWTMTSR